MYFFDTGTYWVNASYCFHDAIEHLKYSASTDESNFLLHG